MRAILRSLPLLLATLGGVASAQPAEEPPPTNEPGPGAPPSPGDPQKDGDAVQQPMADRPADAPAADEPPKGSDSKPTSSVLITFQGHVPPVGEGVTVQEELEEKEHVTWKGTATCEGCEGGLVLMVERKEVPNDKISQVVTTKALAGPGDFELLLPQMDDAVILHLIVDADGSGGPTRGERSAMLELGGTLVPSADRDDLELDATAQK